MILRFYQFMFGRRRLNSLSSKLKLDISWLENQTQLCFQRRWERRRQKCQRQLKVWSISRIIHLIFMIVIKILVDRTVSKPLLTRSTSLSREIEKGRKQNRHANPLRSIFLLFHSLFSFSFLHSFTSCTLIYITRLKAFNPKAFS